MMQKPDVVVSWPVNCDYPLWREFIHDNRDRFQKIIVVFTEAPGMYDYRKAVEPILAKDDVQCFNSPVVFGGEDWRNIAVNAGLRATVHDWIWFTEQDFFPTDVMFDDCDYMVDDGKRVIAAYQGDRMHPCSIFMARDLLGELRLDFGIIPNEADHFYKIQKQLEQKQESIGKLDPKTYTHFNGLSHNWRLVTEGQIPNYHAGEFIQYLRDCLKVSVEIPHEWRRVAEGAIKLAEIDQ